jgi:phenylalanyl-tRNA synthetase beta chain
MLVIADAERSVALAGVMGGANSEVTSGTTAILLESASFNPASINYTSRNLNLASEASMRFARGISPDITIPALKHATQLIAELGGGKIARGIADVYPGKKEQPFITLRKERINRVLALDLGMEQLTASLTALGFEWQKKSEVELSVAVPFWRSDIRQEIDLVEEVARINGYESIPTTMLAEPIPRQDPDPTLNLKRRIRQSLAGYGFQELVTYSLVGMDTLLKLSPDRQQPEPAPLRIANPMTADYEYLRPTLRANLITTLLSNRRHEAGGIMLFELGKVYLPRRDGLPAEPEMLCALLSGNRTEKTWLTPEEPFSFFDARGMLEGLLEQIDIKAGFVPGKDSGLHPGRQVAITASGKQLGILGELHPRAAASFEIDGPVYLFELDMAALLPHIAGHGRYQPVPRFPAIIRDIALVVDAAVPNQKLMDIIGKSQMVKEVRLFDVYSGKQVESGKKSLAYRLTFQSAEHTLTDLEVAKVQQKIMETLSREAGATLRG